MKKFYDLIDVKSIVTLAMTGALIALLFWHKKLRESCTVCL